MLSLLETSKSFGTTPALAGASLEVGQGEFLALLGPSGCGKTTALRVIAGFERPDSGSVEIDGRPVAAPGTWVPPEQRGVGMVFQDYALFPHLDVAGNVGFGLPRAGRAERVAEVLGFVGLGDQARRRPGELSGGQQQRVALARALAGRPSVVLLDEPWSAIDPLRRGEMRDELAAMLRQTGVSVVLVTHDREEAFTLGDRIALMRDGAIAQVGTPEELYYSPADRWCAEFVGGSNFVRQADAEVLLRPEMVGLETNERGEAEVVARTFLGHDVLYHVRLADGTTLSSQRPSNERVELGARVTVRVHDGPQAILPG